MGDLNESRKRVYPLFQKGAKPKDKQSKKIETQPPSSTTAPKDVPGLPAADGPKKAPAKSRKKSEKPVPVPAESSTTQPNFPTLSQGSEHGQAELLDIDPNNHRRKRQKMDSPTSAEPKNEAADVEFPKKGKKGRTSKTNGAALLSQIAANLDQQLPQSVEGLLHVLNGPTPLPITSSTPETDMNHKNLQNGEGNDIKGAPSVPERGPPAETLKLAPVFENSVHNPKPVSKDSIDGKPKKILRLHPKTGTIGSPPPKKSLPSIESTGKSHGRGKSPKSRIVTFRYGPDKPLPIQFGEKINKILDGIKLTAELPKNLASNPPKVTKPASIQPPKSLHPLFMGKAAPKAAKTEVDSADKAPVSESVDLTEPAFLGRARARSQTKAGSPPKSKATSFAGFGKSSIVLKFPGAVEPAWPWQDMVHVRGSQDLPKASSNIASQTRSKSKKSKYQAIQVLSNEDVIASLATELGVQRVVESIREINPDEFPPLPACLRIPIKHYEGGSALQRRLRNQLQAKFPLPKKIPASSSDDEIRTLAPVRTAPHPALTRVYNLIPTTMSAFDLGQCETQSWAHKYCPKSTADVLQSGRDAFVLKEWLQNLTVQSVETGPGGDRASSLSRTGPKSDNAGKRKRKSKKLDGFVISSDEEGNDLDEITDPEDNIESDAGQGLLKKTVVFDSAKSGKVTNTVVISGPHGCGKTAAVYAVAKELGFEVFEINSSTRRSGKDILEKVGDMTRNHLVQRSQGPFPVNDDDKRVDDALAQDLQSGRQGTMGSFFKPKEAPKPKAKPKPKPASKTEAKKNDAPTKAPSKQQKQSLILIEEADILYEADRGFWPTILELNAQSKRPIIITCSDETTLPKDLKLHAHIQFLPPPIDLATDYLLAVAACEGHIIQRHAAKSLYEGRNMDLRASLAELDFWCQFAVGDVKGGLDWFYPRWRGNNDVDADGETIRVVSEGTYEMGMGWLSQDVLESHVHHLHIEVEMLHEAWDGWQLDVGDWQTNIGIESWAKKIETLSSCKNDDKAALMMYESFAETMSEADMFSGQTFVPDNQILLDVNMPELSAKVKEDYTLAHELLEAPLLVDFSTTSKDISLWMKSRARKYLQVDQHIKHGFEVPTQLDRPSEADVIRLITKRATTTDTSLSRLDFSRAFDPISEAEKYVWSTSTALEPSSFDRNMSIIPVDLAPYIRSIVAYDARLQEERLHMSNLLSEGGKRGKRMRTTRAAMSALEGGARSTTRRDRYFASSKLNSQLVLKTGMQSWTEAALVEERAKRKALAARAEAEKPSVENEENEST
ncbi:ATPase family AAA domain-containing protein [Lachnellula suecica]|uniref:ATPase family AAA domain-containing protein n=1 Tax=Lachnellula suecica TaxID=602035 RepID=A0A8T9C486_9HELO|nr:ATPase family AAA domain-containing protein [Lachnellula suecica]